MSRKLKQRHPFSIQDLGTIKVDFSSMLESGETLTGTHVNIELTFAPLPTPRPKQDQSRLLGLYQIIEPQPILKGRPVWRHRITAVFPPKVDRQQAGLRLVANND